MLIPEWRDDAHILKEAIFLSFFVHARVLIHFFEDTSGWPDDVFSSDFGFSPVKLPLPPDVNTRFGHTPESKPWPIRETYSAIKPTATAFVDHVVDTFGPEPPESEQALWRELQRWLHDTESQMIVAKE